MVGSAATGAAAGGTDAVGLGPHANVEATHAKAANRSAPGNERGTAATLRDRSAPSQAALAKNAYSGGVRPTSLRERWLYALKPGSWPKLLVAALLGQAVGIASAGGVNVLALLAGFAFTMLHLAFVVLLNDWGDQDVDALKRRLFPELSSPKTIVDGILDDRSVLLAGLGAGALAAGVAVGAQLMLDRPGLAIGGAACMVLFWAYTLPPLRLNYRGGGEILEMLGVGFALPWWNAYLQSGEVSPAGIVVLPAFLLLALSSALASGLADEPSDRLGGKRTFTVLFGATAVRQAVEGLVIGAMIVWALLPLLAPGAISGLVLAPVIIVMAMEFVDLREVGASSEVDTYIGIGRYKQKLHDCIWRGTAVLAVLLAAGSLLFGGHLG